VTADGLWTWNGTTYVRKPSQSSLSIFGVAKLRTGEERLIVSENTSHFKAYGVDTGQANTWLTAPTDAPTAGNVAWESMRASSDFFKKMGMPAFLGSGGLITIWDTSKENLPYIFYCRPAPRVDAAGGRTRSDSYIAFRDATDPAGNELWTTAKLNGVATDMALEDVKTAGKRGLLILTNSATGDKVRTLYFYGLD
jgi:hypothetical protein